jgi:hypothetical protein
MDQIHQEALKSAENDGIVFIDEIDKIANREGGWAPASPAKACSATCCRWSRERPWQPNTVR